jgi:Peptidase C39 family/Protein of unknown function (DUF1573)
VFSFCSFLDLLCFPIAEPLAKGVTRNMIPLTLSILLAGVPLAEPTVPSTEEAINWDDYAPCGLVSLYLTCQMQDKAVSWEEVKKLVGPPRPDGELNFANLATAASQLGMHPVGLEVSRASLHNLPMPAIIQVRDPQYPDELPHFLVLLRPEADGVRLLDAPFPPYFLPEDRFQLAWTGKILVFAQDEKQAQQIRDFTNSSTATPWINWGLLGGGAILLSVLGVMGRPWRSKVSSTPSTAATIGTPDRRFAGSMKKPLFIAGSLLFLTAVFSSLPFLPVFLRAKEVPPRCEFDAQVMNLGELTPGTHSIQVPIKNSGSKPLQITQASSNCSCCAVVRSPDQIEPQQSTTLDTQLQVIPGTRTIQVTVESNDPEGPKHILLYWHGKAEPKLLPRWISATNVPLDHPYERTVKLIYPGGKSALVPHLKSYQCDRQGVEVHEGRNDPLSSKFTTLGLLTNIIGEMELHVRIQPPSKPEHLQAYCKLLLTYGKDEQTINLPLIISFAGGQLAPDVSSVTFSAAHHEELLSQERLVRIPDQDPRGEINVSNAPSWLSCEIQRTTDKAHLLRLKVVSVPPALPEQDVIHIARKDGMLCSTLRVSVLGGDAPN